MKYPGTVLSSAVEVSIKAVQGEEGQPDFRIINYYYNNKQTPRACITNPPSVAPVQLQLVNVLAVYALALIRGPCPSTRRELRVRDARCITLDPAESLESERTRDNVCDRK